MKYYEDQVQQTIDEITEIEERHEKVICSVEEYDFSDAFGLLGEACCNKILKKVGIERAMSVREWKDSTELDNLVSKYVEQNQTSSAETDKEKKYRLDGMKQRLRELANAFFEEYPPQKFAEEYNRLYSMEPSFANYKCYKEMPKNIHISTLEYDISPLGLSDYTKDFLDRYYFFLHRDNKLCIPYCVSFGPEFNYLFKFEAEKREDAVKNACDLGMRLFMMLPPGKVNFTFADPVALGASFAMFTRLVDVNDRTSEVINGKIWSTPADIEQKLKIMTDHISNVTQRCLQGKYAFSIPKRKVYWSFEARYSL